MPMLLSKRVLCLLLGGVVLPSFAGAPFVLSSYVIGNGSQARAGNACSRLIATLGEPVAGVTSGGSFVLEAGFLATTQDARDTLFFDGFEGCVP